MEEIKLISPSIEYDDDIMQFRQEMMDANDSDSFAGCGSLRPCSTTEEWLAVLNQWKMFQGNGISFDKACVVDGRMAVADAQKTVKEADVVWLSGGNTPVEFAYLEKYGLDTILRQHEGVVIGMSAGSINMAKNAICTLSCGHAKQEIYEGLGFVDFSVEPHFVREKLSDELLELSKEYMIYGLCDDSIIVSKNGKVSFYGEVYQLKDGQIHREQVNT